MKFGFKDMKKGEPGRRERVFTHGHPERFSVAPDQIEDRTWFFKTGLELNYEHYVGIFATEYNQKESGMFSLMFHVEY